MLDSFKLDGKVALVTGASSGIGQAIAIALAEAGADVACHARSAGKAEYTCSTINSVGRRSVALAGDISDRDIPARIVEECVDTLGEIDILINNAGTIRRAPAVDYSEDDWTAVVETNLSSVFRLSQAAGRRMIARGAGKIVNIASLLSFQGGVTVPAYTASKSGVAGLTKVLSNEWAAKGVNVNAIAPGYISTKNTAALQADETRNRQILDRVPAGRWGTPGDIAGAAVFLASSASDYMHGHIMVVDGGWMGR
ncbi:MAG: 2-dehydro-3-deoxy-D-gluconate 5-dehydrogenase KduD [Pyrinomonadaceae bacterium]